VFEFSVHPVIVRKLVDRLVNVAVRIIDIVNARILRFIGIFKFLLV